MTFELWNLETGNRIAGYETRDAALTAVRGLLDTDRSYYSRALALFRGEADAPDAEILLDGPLLAQVATRQLQPNT